MTKTKINKVMADLRRHQSKIAKERDALREFLSEVEEVLNDCEEACELIEGAVDALSRLQ